MTHSSKRLMTIALCISLTTSLAFAENNNAGDQSPVELRDGDRVVFLGGTFVERMQSYAYLETLLTIARPELNVTFRNLGWSGDDVWGTSRALFGTQADGFKRLRNDLVNAKPTVIVVAYGANEAHAGSQGLPKFAEGLTNLLNVLEATGARIVLMTPPRREKLAPPLPDPSRYNKNLLDYNQATREVAAKRKHHFIDFFSLLGTASEVDDQSPAVRDRLTDNGMHFNEYGYWRTAPILARAFRESPFWRVSIGCKDSSYDAVGTLLTRFQVNATSVKFDAVDDRLPYSPPPAAAPSGANLVAPHAILRIRGLAPGEYGLRIDDAPTVRANHTAWAAGVHLNLGQYIQQTEQLRSAIIDKNALFFYRYRPQNETYLFLFRKHEQGNNAVEIPQFDPLIAEKEKQIAALKKPNTRIFRLVRVKAQKSGNK